MIVPDLKVEVNKVAAVNQVVQEAKLIVRQVPLEPAAMVEKFIASQM